MNYVFVTRENKKWLVKAHSADQLRTLCCQLGWIFGSFTDAHPVAANLYKPWKIGELVDEIGRI